MEPCKRGLVSSIGIKDNQDVQYGINHNETHCTGEVGNCGCIHAEADLISKMTNPDIVIVSHSPCIECAKKLVRAGVKIVYFAILYRKTEGIDFLLENDVKVILLTENGAVEL